ncbi:MAG: hypothetical protein ACOCRX_01135 [Candidatus Woesearchaeota archaeon]
MELIKSLKKSIFVLILVSFFLLFFIDSLAFNDIINGNDHTLNSYTQKNCKNYDISKRKTRWCSDDAILRSGNGNSMDPHSWSSGHSWFDRIEFSDVELGDIIVYKAENRTIRHSVVSINKDYLITAGYNNKDDSGNTCRDKNNVYPNQVLYRECIPKSIN